MTISNDSIGSNFTVGFQSNNFGVDPMSGLCIMKRSGFLRGLDVVGYIPGVGSITGALRGTITRIIEWCCHGAAAIKNPFIKSDDARAEKNAQYKFKANYYRSEANRGALELIPFATIVRDCWVYSNEKNKDENKKDYDGSTFAFGNHYNKGTKGEVRFAFTADPANFFEKNAGSTE